MKKLFYALVSTTVVIAILAAITAVEKGQFALAFELITLVFAFIFIKIIKAKIQERAYAKAKARSNAKAKAKSQEIAIAEAKAMAKREEERKKEIIRFLSSYEIPPQKPRSNTQNVVEIKNYLEKKNQVARDNLKKVSH